MVGRLVATGILQGGPGLPIFMPAFYQYMCGEEGWLEHMDGDIPDPLIRNLLGQVSSSKGSNACVGQYHDDIPL